MSAAAPWWHIICGIDFDYAFKYFLLLESMVGNFPYIILFAVFLEGNITGAQPMARSAGSAYSFVQQTHRTASKSRPRRNANEDSVRASHVFSLVQKGIQKEDVEIFSGSFASQVNVSLRATESGYYSANQARYVLKNFFGARRVVNFRLSTILQDEVSPYATGAGSFVYQGKREVLQVYVGLTKTGHQWMISQFNVY